MARPTSLTPEVQRAICAALEKGNYLETAASAGGVHRNTLRSWIQRGEVGEEPYAAFLCAVKTAEDKGERLLLRTIRKGVDGWQARAWIMERRWPARWGGRVRITVNEELSNVLRRIESKLDPETFAKVIDATREDAPGASAEARH